MVIFGGLEIVAAGYLLNEFNQDKVKERERRKKRRDDDGRPHSRPPHVDSQQHKPNSLQPPPHGPPRPLSAPPIDPRPGRWQQQPPQQQWQQHPPPQQRQQQGFQQRPQQPPTNPYIQALQNDQTRPGQPAPWQIPPYQWQPTLQPQHQQGPPPPGPGPLQRPNTFQPPQQHQQPPGQGFLQQASTFPPQGQQQPQGHVYVDSKTGRVSHNLYPPDHPMARGHSHDDSEISKGGLDTQAYNKQMAGDMNTGRVWDRRNDDDLAYGKDYSNSEGRRRRSTSFDRRRQREGSLPGRYELA